MTPEVELFSATDPPHFPDRNVWYYIEFHGMRSEQLNDHATVLARAKAICAEHGAVLLDRSDRGSGYLLRTLGK